MRGQLLVGEAGYVYRIINRNGANIEFWLAPAELVVCEQLDSAGESYLTISNKDTNEIVIAILQP
jgi:hypothetical protein